MLASLQQHHPPAAELLKTTQDTLDSLRQFIVAHHVITVPPSQPARVKETPPFMRSTTSASMDTPGPFEPATLEGAVLSGHAAARSALRALGVEPGQTAIDAPPAEVAPAGTTGS